LACDTPLKNNRSLENEWLEDVFPTEIVPFFRDMFVFGVLAEYEVSRKKVLHIHGDDGMSEEKEKLAIGVSYGEDLSMWQSIPTKASY